MWIKIIFPSKDFKVYNLEWVEHFSVSLSLSIFFTRKLKQNKKKTKTGCLNKIEKLERNLLFKVAAVEREDLSYLSQNSYLRHSIVPWSLSVLFVPILYVRSLHPCSDHPVSSCARDKKRRRLPWSHITALCQIEKKFIASGLRKLPITSRSPTRFT